MRVALFFLCFLKDINCMEVLKCFPSEWIGGHVCVGPEHQIFWDDVCVSICSDAARSPLVWFGVVSLTAGARIWIIFCLWYRWQPATHPETQRHILQLRANCCKLFVFMRQSSYFHAHAGWSTLTLSVCVLHFYICSCDRSLIHFYFLLLIPNFGIFSFFKGIVNPKWKPIFYSPPCAGSVDIF